MEVAGDREALVHGGDHGPEVGPQRAGPVPPVAPGPRPPPSDPVAQPVLGHHEVEARHGVQAQVGEHALGVHGHVPLLADRRPRASSGGAVPGRAEVVGGHGVVVVDRDDVERALVGPVVDGGDGPGQGLVEGQDRRPSTRWTARRPGRAAQGDVLLLPPLGQPVPQLGSFDAGRPGQQHVEEHAGRARRATRRGCPSTRPLRAGAGGWRRGPARGR